MKVSILILAHNEAANLPACLAALTWCDDILVIDSGSTDDSVAIAEAHGCRVLHRPFDNFAGQRNFGLEQGAFKHDWILHLDADEVVTPAFLAALEALEPSQAPDAWRVPFKTMLFGKWLRHAGMWPAYQVRLGHAQRLRFVQVGHGQREALPPERVGDFPEALLHYSFSHGLRRWLEKHVRYAADEAAEMIANPPPPDALKTALFGADATSRRRAVKALAGRMPLFWRPFARFFYIYFVRRGFLDGRAGLAYAFMLGTYEAMTAILAFEAQGSAGGRMASNRMPPPTTSAPGTNA